MLQIVVPASPEQEYWDSQKQEFVYLKGTNAYTLQLEHSLVSVSKWESKWKKPFLKKNAKTTTEILDYIRCMTITQNVPNEVYEHLTNENLEAVQKYIQDSMTATTFKEENTVQAANRSDITAEIIYYWMISLGIPIEFQKWHLNRLLTLIKVCDIKNRPAKKRSNREILQSNAALNASRRKKYNTRG